MTKIGASIELFRSDKDLETKGVWVTIEHEVRLLVARMNNPKYLAFLRELMKPHQSQLRPASRRYRKDSPVSMPDVDMDSELLETLAAKAMARHILMGWMNLSEPKRDEEGEIVLEDGNPVLIEVEYSSEKAEEYILEYREFYLLVVEIASDEALYRESAHKDAEEN